MTLPRPPFVQPIYDHRRLIDLENRFDGPIPSQHLRLARRDPANAQIARFRGQARAFRRLAELSILGIRRWPDDASARQELAHYLEQFRTWNRAAWSLVRHQERVMPRTLTASECELLKLLSGQAE